MDHLQRSHFSIEINLPEFFPTSKSKKEYIQEINRNMAIILTDLEATSNVHKYASAKTVVYLFKTIKRKTNKQLQKRILYYLLNKKLIESYCSHSLLKTEFKTLVSQYENLAKNQLVEKSIENPTKNKKRWNLIAYRKLLRKDELTIEEQAELQKFRSNLYAQLCYLGRSDFTEWVSAYLHKKISSDVFRHNFIWLSSEFINLLQDIEECPIRLTDYNIDYEIKWPFFNFHRTILEISIKIDEKLYIMEDNDFRTLVARSYYEQLIFEDI